MKKCPFCAEEIQDAAVKCRYCGSMVGPSPEGTSTDTAAPDGAPPATTPAPASRPAPWMLVGLGVIGALLVVIGILLARGSAPSPTPTLPPVVTTEAASMAPSQATSGDYLFLGVPWGSSRADVRARLEARGFKFLETDDEGDDQFEGRVDGRDAGVAAMYGGDTLTKFLVILLTPDDTGGLLTNLRRNIAAAYGPSAEERGPATIWPERSGTLVWITTTEEHQIRVHYEAASWPNESKKRKEGRTTGD